MPYKLLPIVQPTKIKEKFLPREISSDNPKDSVIKDPENPMCLTGLDRSKTEIIGMDPSRSKVWMRGHCRKCGSKIIYYKYVFNHGSTIYFSCQNDHWSQASPGGFSAYEVDPIKEEEFEGDSSKGIINYEKDNKEREVYGDKNFVRNNSDEIVD